MITYFFENDFVFGDTDLASERIRHLIENEGKELGEISYIFCNDDYLLQLNQKYLQHDTYTDIITFDYTIDQVLSGDIYISTERVTENAIELKIRPDQELYRVMYHGVLHLCGYKDKSTTEQAEMRKKEEYYLHLHS